MQSRQIPVEISSTEWGAWGAGKANCFNTLGWLMIFFTDHFQGHVSLFKTIGLAWMNHFIEDFGGSSQSMRILAPFKS